jgi:hypothetical protein
MDNMILNLGRLQDALPWFMLTYFWEDTNQILDMYIERPKVETGAVSRFQQLHTLRVSYIPSRPCPMPLFF